MPVARINGVTVKLNGSPIPISAVAPEQITCLVPLEVTAASSLAVSYAGIEAPAAQLEPGAFRRDAAPGIFTLSDDVQGAVLIGGAGLIARSPADAQARPARHGEVVEIYATGLGTVSTPPVTGEAGSADPLSRTVGDTITMIGGIRAAVLYSGLAPGMPGVYQVNAVIPQDSPSGDRVPVTAQVNADGIGSNVATIAIE